MNLIAYANESGTHDPTGAHHGAEVAGIAAYLADKEAWDSFTCDWTAVLKRHDVEVFHTSDFVDKKNRKDDPEWDYFGWEEPKRDCFTKELIAIARHWPARAVGGCIALKDYEALVPPRFKRNPYFFCLHLLLDAIFTDDPSAGPNPLLSEGEKVDFFFDQQKEFEFEARGSFANIKALRDTQNRMGQLTFADKKNHPPLQAADLLAYVSRQAEANRINGKQKVGLWENSLLVNGRNVDYHYYDKENLTLLFNALNTRFPAGIDEYQPRGKNE